ncbi:MAG: NAD(P)-binding oxidoreductase, partial [Bacteroidota bacterium]
LAGYADQPALTIVKGSPEDPSALAEAVQGCEAIISVLNVSRTSDFPWAPLRSPKDLMSRSMSQLLALPEAASVQRLVVCSAWGVAETKAELPFWFRWLIDYSNLKFPYLDHERQETIIRQSQLKWTLVRPVGLTPFSRIQTVRESYANQPRPRLTINRESLAAYLLAALERDDLIGKAPTISAE